MRSKLSSGRRSLVGGGGGGVGGATALWRLAGLLALVLGVGLALTASASAATHTFKGTFGAATSVPSNPYPLSAPASVAIDDSAGPSAGDSYVADPPNHWLEKFDATGELVWIAGKEVDRTAVEAVGTEAEQNLCVIASGDVCQPGAAASTPGAFETASFVAVDGSTSASAGDVYVADTGDDLVTKLAPDGSLITGWGEGGQLAGSSATGTGNLEVGSTVIESLTTEIGAFTAGQEISAAGIPAGTTITAVAPGSLEISEAATTTGSASLGARQAFGPIGGIAVDSAGRLLLLNEGERFFRFSQDGGFLESFQSPYGVAPHGIAVNSAGDVYLVRPSGAVAEVTPSGAEVDFELDPGPATGLAVDPAADDLYVDHGLAISRYDSSRHLLEVFGSGHLIAGAGLAVGPDAELQAADTAAGDISVFALFGPNVTAAPASGITATEATLHGTVAPTTGGDVTGCRFEYVSAEAFERAGYSDPTTVACAPAPPYPAATEVSAVIVGLNGGTTYHFRLAASDANTTTFSSEATFTVQGPSIDATSVSGVSATAATLEAELNPHGLPTTYHFEYDTTAYTEAGPAHGTATATGSAGSGSADVTRTAPVQALAPNTTYHLRVVAENVLGTSVGPDRSFTTQGAAATLLPDSRAWELVSPADKHGAPLEGLAQEGGVIQAAADGSALAYISNGPVGTESEGNRSVNFSQLLARREGPGNWSTRDISTPHQEPAGVHPGLDSEYRLFSTDLSSAGLEPFGATPLSQAATARTPYLRSDFDGAGFCTGACYRPLVTGCPEASGVCPPAVEDEANVPAGTKFGTNEGNEIRFITGTPDLSHTLFASHVALVPGFENGGQRAIYESSEGRLTPISVLPTGSSAGSAVGGNQDSQVRHALSTDGSRVVFATDNPSNLYLRANSTAPQSASGACDEAGRACTIQLDAKEPGCAGCESGGGIFQIASADDSRIFFTDANRLTESSTAANGSPDLYMCQIDEPQPGHVACNLTDLTANTLDPAAPAAVLGAVIGAATDGSSVYFVAQGALTEGEGAVNGDCSFVGTPEVGDGECNLYRYDVADASTRLVAVLSGQDYNDWAAKNSGQNLGELTARVSPNGRYLAFMSQRSVTGYDNRDAKTNMRDQEVYLYDSAAGPGSGLACASCNPTGARPHGVFDAGVFPGLLVDRAGSVSNWERQTLAGNVPGWTQYKLGSALYQSRYLSDSGRLFFNAADALVPADTNGTFDVYEFEYPQGPGQPESNSCTTASSTYSPRSGGCVSLISSGTSPEESAFLDASETGNDVFFLTASRLTAKDEDKALDVYDARVGGGEPEVVRPVECSGDACQQPAVPPNDATPGSLTFSGAGNVLQCPKGKVVQKGRCVKKSPPEKKHKKNGKHPKKKNGKGKKSKRNAGKKPGGGK